MSTGNGIITAGGHRQSRTLSTRMQFCSTSCCFLTLPCPAPCSTVAAYCVAAFAPNMAVANALLPVYIGTLLFFVGFLIKLDQIPS